MSEKIFDFTNISSDKYIFNIKFRTKTNFRGVNSNLKHNKITREITVTRLTVS